MIYLNNAATTYPKPATVVSAVTNYLTHPPSQGTRGSQTYTIDLATRCRQRTACFLGITNPNQLIFTSSGTHSLNLAINGLQLDYCHVVTTAIEHNSVLRPLKRLEKMNRIELSIVPCDSCGFVAPEMIQKAIQPNTRLIVMNHVSNVSGSVNDIAAIVKISQKTDIPLLIDASQAVGTIPYSIEELGADLVAFTCHKGLLGLPGLGGLYIADRISLSPLMVGGTGVKSQLLEQPDALPLRYETGTPNYPAMAALIAGLDYIEEMGFERIRSQKDELISFFLAQLDKYPGIHIHGSKESANREPIFSITLDGVSNKDAAYILEESYQVRVREGLHCAPLIHQYLGAPETGSIRLSFSIFTTIEQLQYVLTALGEICLMKG
jgi:cysteine desulfurase / selenocysteine lyase